MVYYASSSIGAVAGPLTKLPDGSTPAGREVYAAFISQAVHALSADLQQIIDDQFSGLRVLLRPGPFIAQTVARREELILARQKLTSELLPAALLAVRDYSRSLANIQNSVDAYFETLARQVGAATSAEARSSLMGFWRRVSREAMRLALETTAATSEQLSRLVAEAAASAAQQTAAKAMQNLYFGGLLLGASVFGVAYLVRSFRGGS